MVRSAMVTVVAFLAFAAGASATPIAHNDKEREQYGGRVIPEPRDATNYLQFGANGSEAEFKDAFDYLQRLYPRYVTLTTVAKETNNPLAVSTGNDGIPAGMPGDTNDGHPLYIIKLTDSRVPDRRKAYVSLMFAHSAEVCGREGVLRSVEDLAMAAAKDSPQKFTDDKGFVGPTHQFTAAQLLAKTKIFVSVTSPDGWAKGDAFNGYSQDNGAGLNSNRVAPQDGWSYLGDVLYRHGYATATQSEGIAVTDYLHGVRMRELKGKPFAAGADLHGPVPSGTVLVHDQGNDPIKLIVNQDFAQRVRNATYGVLRGRLGPGADAYEAAGTGLKQAIRDAGYNYYQVPNAWALPTEWVTYGQIWDQLGYTAGSTWGGWMNSASGLGAPSVSYEMNCVPGAGGAYAPEAMQLYVDNVRAVVRTTVVRAAAPRADGITKIDLGLPAAFYDDGTRVTDKDGNPTPPPAGFPNRPLKPQVPQVHYDVSQTDYFRDLSRQLVSSPLKPVGAKRLRSTLGKVGTLAIADQVPSAADTDAIASWVHEGGNLVLTDRALTMLPKLGVGTDADVVQRWGYVGYADLDLSDPLTQGLPRTARQTYDPIGLGMQTLMERDAYYGCSSANPTTPTGSLGGCEDSGTQNSAPIWSIAKAAFNSAEAPPVRFVGTVDPPATRKDQQEGTAVDQAEIGVITYGKGRITFFGALLPRPTEANPHWYGLNAYTIGYTGQTMLLRAMTAKGTPQQTSRQARRRAPLVAPRAPRAGAVDPFSGAVVGGGR